MKEFEIQQIQNWCMSTILGGLKTVSRAWGLSKTVRTLIYAVSIVSRDASRAPRVLLEKEVALDGMLQAVGTFWFELIAL